MGTICHHTMSLDGFIAGPDDSMDWAFAYGETTSLANETMKRIGAILAGRRWYQLATERWNGVGGIYGGAYDGGSSCLLTGRPTSAKTQESASFRMGSRRPSQPLRPQPGTGTWRYSALASANNASRPACSMR